MFMDKGVLEEEQPAYIGMYDGTLMNENVRRFVEGCDRPVRRRADHDFNTGAFTAAGPRRRSTSVTTRSVDGTPYQNVEMRDILAALAHKLPKRRSPSGRVRPARRERGAWRRPHHG